MNKNVIIIGGGVAGLSAAIHLAELGISCVVIERDCYPKQKICSDFISPEAIPLLEKWEISLPVFLYEFELIAGMKSFLHHFEQPAASMSRFHFDHALVQRAQQCGVKIMMGLEVTSIARENGEYRVTLSSCTEIVGGSLIVGSRRVAHAMTTLTQSDTCIIQSTLNVENVPFVGITSHFNTVLTGNRVVFFSFPGAYLSISRIEDGKTNVACLAKTSNVQASGDVAAFMANLAYASCAGLLREVIIEGCDVIPEWMSCSVPAFGIKKTTFLPQVYYVGEALASIPPATGDSLALELFMGKMVTEYLIKNDTLGFVAAWRARYKSVMRAAELLHLMFLHPSLTKCGIKFCEKFPQYASKIFACTRLL